MLDAAVEEAEEVSAEGVIGEVGGARPYRCCSSTHRAISGETALRFLRSRRADGSACTRHDSRRGRAVAAPLRCDSAAPAPRWCARKDSETAGGATAPSRPP